MMDPEKIAQWQAADAAFDHWLDLPDSERDAWLASQDLPEPVRRRLVQLITAHERPRAALDPAGDNLAGCRLGDWTLDTELGRGGMAVVYRAWREEGMARQQAAVKILTLGALGATGRERFRREATILARLNHPNVTALIDSGVADDGTCWLAMPLVDGERIDRWCDAKSLDARAIVRLYLQVCGAVAYAHRNLVIHRDIKPSNVLVDDNGHVRLLDFGIGQFTDTQDERTHTMWRALTPGYAAPEQLTGAPPSTAVDVYGLGALLHRLLTGRTPQAATENTDTTRPSLLVRGTDDAYHRHYVPLKNDLDRVLLKALAEEPERRYATAEALAEDLHRWLDGQPVLAQTPGAAYRLRKFVARNRVGVAAGVLLAASLAGGVGATLWQAGEASREAENARIHAQRAILVRDFLQRVFTSTDPASGAVPDALELLDEGARRARATVLAEDPLAAADILMLTGKARLELDDLDNARADLEQAAGVLAANDAAAYPERSRIEADLTRVMRLAGDIDAALAHGDRAVEFGKLAMAATGDATPYVDARISRGEALFGSDQKASLAEFEEIVQAIPGYGLENTELHLTALIGLSVLAFAVDPEDMERHVGLSEEVIRLSRAVDGPDSGWYANALANQIPVFVEAGDNERAEQVALEAVALADRIYEGPHSTKATVYCAAGVYFHGRDRIAEALEYYSVADAINAGLPHSPLSVESCFRMSGHAHLNQGQLHTALENLDRSWKIHELHGRQTSRHGYATCGMQASAHLRLGAMDAARRTLEACPANEKALESLQRTQAQAELHFMRAEFEEAGRLVAALRERHPPLSRRGIWMRPWMLSLLLAHKTGDTAAKAALAAELDGFADKVPLSRCLAAPNEADCLAIL